METINQLLDNNILWVALLATVLAQVLKVLLVLMFERKLNLARMRETGGMPSSHSAAVTALATGIGLSYGFNSPLFAISAVLAVIVIYDATGIRRAAGKHAEVLNNLTKEISHLLENGYQQEALKTLLGHTFPQVFMGSLLGTGLAILLIG